MGPHVLRGPGSQQGSVLVISIMLMAVMLTIGLASFSFVDTGQVRAREQRERETALNITEAVLYSQGFALARRWPGNSISGTATPTTCTSASIQSLCPNPNTLAAANSSTPASANFTNADASSNVSWTTRIRDNGAPLSDAFDLAKVDAAQSGTSVKTGIAYTCAGPCKWDANGDRKLWVQARAVVRGQPRNIVALLKREQFAETFARNGVTAGSFETPNHGNKTIIDARGSQVVVRCTSSGAACTDYNAAKIQVLPTTIVRAPATPPQMTATQIARFKASAESANPSTYYTSCPSTFTGTIVFIDVSSTTNCIDPDSVTYNSPSDPGIVIMPRGTLEMQGVLHGLIYMANGQNSSAQVLKLRDNAEIFGGVAIDGAGRLLLGQASGPRPTITFVPRVFDALATFGTTGLVQNTWRELAPN